MTTPHWYDLLDVDPDASTDEIRAAWKSSIADLDPGDRRFRAFSEAAAILLDPVRRAEYDAELAASAEAEAEPLPLVETEPVPDEAVVSTPATSSDEAPGTTSGRTELPLAVVIVTAIATVVLVAVTVVAWLGSDSAPDSLATGPARVDESETRAAQAAAETAIVPVISYDYRKLDESAAAAKSYMTDEFAERYDETFSIVETNAAKSKTVVGVEVVASGIVRTGEDRVDVLLFINRPTTNTEYPAGVISRDQATLQMKLVDGEWLVDGLVTTPAAP